MDFVSGLLVTLPQPAGFWESIINAFGGVNGTYIIAVIILALLIRVVLSFFDIFNKKVSMKTNEINTKMKPELDAIRAKYANDQATLQKKTNDIYKKYQFNMMGSCLPMLINLVLSTVIFLTLWSSLQTVSNYNIASQYQEMKYTYANIIEINDYLLDTEFSEGDNLVLNITINDEGKKVINVDLYNGEIPIKPILIEHEFKTDWSNENIYYLLQKYVLLPQPDNEETADETEETPEAPKIEYIDTGFNSLVLTLAENTVKDYYLQTQEGFLWIKNIYKAESPQSPLFTENEIKNYLSKYYSGEEAELETANDYEGKIFQNIIASFEGVDLGLNGYYILTIIAALSSFFAMWFSNFLIRKTNNAQKDDKAPKQKQPWAMYIIMPIIMAIFTFMYTSLFAIYIIAGQLASIALSPITTLIVNKWTKISENKNKDKSIVEVDYRRKD